jgi:hypothetical protein
MTERKDAGNLAQNREEEYERPEVSRRTDSDLMRNSPISPNLPKANIVADD